MNIKKRAASARGTSEAEVSRRVMLKHAGLTAGLGMVVAFASSPLGASLASASTSTSKPDVNEGERCSAVPPGLTDLAGIHAEYLSAIAAFPFVLPAGAVFPAASSLRDSVSGEMWERGAGEAEAYFFWHDATVSAAEDAANRGNDDEARQLLSALESAFKSAKRQAVWEDTDEVLSSRIAKAKKGDFSALSGLIA